MIDIAQILESQKKNLSKPIAKKCECGTNWVTRNGIDRANCDCADRLATRQEVIRHLNLDSRIQAEFMITDYKILDKELQPYYDNLDWVTCRADVSENDQAKRKTKSLYISGASGSCKTGQATVIAKRVITEKLGSVRYYQARELVYQRDTEDIKQVGLLIIDNLGKDAEFEQKNGTLFDLIDYRLHEFYSTIVITDEMQDINKAIISRFKKYEKILISRGDQR